MKCAPVAIPDPEKTTQRPKINQQDLGKTGRANAWNQEVLDDIVLTGDETTEYDPHEQREDNIAGCEANDQRSEGGHQRQNTVMLLLFDQRRIQCPRVHDSQSAEQQQ